MDAKKVKRIIKGAAKTTGKYTLKALGKGVELTARGSLKTVDALIKNPQIQKLATGAGILATSVMIPPVGVGLIGLLGLKYMLDKSLSGNNKGILDEVNDVLRMGTSVTGSICDGVISTALKKSERDAKKIGAKFQAGIDRLFR